MLWINFLHLYQPVNTDAYFIKEATELSYARIIRAIEEHPNLKFTLNITGALILRWGELGYKDLLVRLNNLKEKGQVELTGTAAYHPLLPLIPKEEVARQIKENEEILKKHFGENFHPKGFFLPEMAYGPKVAKIIKKLGYEWIILDEIANGGKLGETDFNKVYEDKNSGLKIIFRSRPLSESYVPETLNKIMAKEKDNNLVITATDAELYGLRHNDPTAEFEKILKNPNLGTKTISEFIDEHKETEKIKPVAGSWISTEEELKNNEPYLLWSDKKNKIQKNIWELANLPYKTTAKYKKDINAYWARWHLVRGLASCTFWWASGKDFSHIFGPLSWNPDEIERGINELIRAVRTLDDASTKKTKIKSEKLYLKIKQLIWKKHWTYYWKKT
ncbi:MAG: polysaccharide deacetylase family protein [Patescibacteria group bacterium]|nr:polysaccharide deacetylase family protein [Patescibacteria group bacterium]